LKDSEPIPHHPWKFIYLYLVRSQTFYSVKYLCADESAIPSTIFPNTHRAVLWNRSDFRVSRFIMIAAGAAELFFGSFHERRELNP
jgi:hypothetical protein